VSPGAVVVIAATNDLLAGMSGSANRAGIARSPFLSGPAACVEIAGRSTIERTIQRLLASGVENISVIVEAEIPGAIPVFRTPSDKVKVQVVHDIGSAIARTLSEHSQRDIEHSFIHWADTYAETDLLDLFYFHREARQATTGTFNSEGPMGLWVVDCEKAQSLPFESAFEAPNRPGSSYFVREYVKRLTTARDLGEFAEDMLGGRCEDRPCGKEVRPGIWMDEGAEIHRGARIVAPAYIGRRVEVMEDALITRFSCIERDCCVDSGTVIEKSCILANTHVGIWLDVCHAIVNGSKMFSLKRDVMVEIGDPAIMRSTSSVHSFAFGHSERNRGREVVRNSAAENPIPAMWQLGVNFIQE
jgi:NDP-sugar pyrophosphorylase family protein